VTRAGRQRPAGGFTLLEVMISMAILAVSLVAILNLSSGAVRMYNHSKFLTVASLLARSKMVDVEEKLYDEEFPDFNDEETGSFEKEGYPNFKWKADIVKPDIKVDATQLMSMVGGAMGLKPGDLPTGDDSSSDSKSGGPTQAGGLSGMIGPMVAQLGPMVNQSIREVRVTVSWKDITGPSSITVVTHVVKVPGQAAPGSLQQQQQNAQQQRLQQLKNSLGNLPNLPPALQRSGIIPALGGQGGANFIP
jgi:general secretion pathway protein I